MADERFDIDPELERELTQLGPLIARQEAAEAQVPDAQFISSLRARLIGGTAGTAEPEPERPLPEPVPLENRRLRGNSTRGTGGRHTPLRRFRAPVFLGGLLTAAMAAAVLALVINSRNATSPGTGTRQNAFAVPTPNPTELGRTYPVRGLGGGGGPPEPWQTEAQVPQGSAYPVHLTLGAGPLRYGPRLLPAYELAGPSFDAGRVAQIAQALGISAQVKRSTQPDGIWAYAAQYATITNALVGGTMRTIHSVAVNLRTGELIYHDTRSPAGSGTPRPVNDPRNVATARAFLTGAGWPAGMPLHPAMSPQEGFGENQVTLGWAHAGETDAPQAVVITDSHGTVIDASALPPVARSSTVRVKGYPAAWKQVAAGTVGVAVDITAGSPSGLAGGTGAVTRTDTLDVLTTTPAGASYLVPAYRFRGTVKITGIAPIENWVSVVPAPK